MTLQQYINKIQDWIDQGRLTLPEGSKALVRIDEDGDFFVEIVNTEKDHKPFAKAEAVLG